MFSKRGIHYHFFLYNLRGKNHQEKVTMVNKNFTLLPNILREITQEFMETEEGYVTVVLYTLCFVILRKLSSRYRQVSSRDWYQLRTCVVARLIPITDMCDREIGTN